MVGKFHHEEIYRGAEAVTRLGAVQLTLCGVGALGSQLADNLARQGFRQLRLIDRDRIEEHNVGTQLYGLSDVGGWKVDVLRQRLFRSTGVEVDAVQKELSPRNAVSLLKGAGIVIDTFDNSDGRRTVQEQCRRQNTPCLHVGLHSDYAEVIWDAGYRVPRDVAGDVCDYPLARNLVLLAVATASECVVAHVLHGVDRNLSITLRDLAVSELPARADAGSP